MRACDSSPSLSWFHGFQIQNDTPPQNEAISSVAAEGSARLLPSAAARQRKISLAIFRQGEFIFAARFPQ